MLKLHESTFSSVAIVDFEEVNVSWERSVVFFLLPLNMCRALLCFVHVRY